MTAFARTCLMLALFAATAATPAHAQDARDYPNRPIKVVVPFPAGGPTDGMARIISDRLGAVLGQSIVIENRGGGAGGSVGAKFVATADPDGYTILMTPGGPLTTGPAMHTNIGYDPVKVFTPVGLLIETPQIISVHPDLPVKSLRRGRGLRQSQSGQAQLGLAGLRHGSAPACRNVQARNRRQHRARALPRHRADARRHSGRRDPDRRRRQHHQPAAHPGRQAAADRRHRWPQRFSKLPDVPTTAEAGYPKLLAPFWLGVVAPAGTPPDIVDKLNAAFRDSLAPPETRARLANLGAEIKIGTPAEFGKLLADELRCGPPS